MKRLVKIAVEITIFLVAAALISTVFIVTDAMIPDTAAATPQTLSLSAETKESPQIVFVVQHQDTDGIKHLTPHKDYLAIISIVPADPFKRYAPLRHGDKMLCRMFDAKEETGHQIIGLRCGSDKYYIKGLSVLPKKELK